MSYWNQKLEKVKTETEKQTLEKQIKEVEQEIEAIKWEVFFLCSWWKSAGQTAELSSPQFFAKNLGLGLDTQI